jgi:hypothetical protein
VGLGLGPLSLASTTEELLVRKSSGGRHSSLADSGHGFHGCWFQMATRKIGWTCGMWTCWVCPSARARLWRTWRRGTTIAVTWCTSTGK